MARGTGAGAQGSEGGGCRGPGPGAGGPGPGGDRAGERACRSSGRQLCALYSGKRNRLRGAEADTRLTAGIRGAGHWRPRLRGRAGPGRAGLGWAARAAARPGSGAWIWGRRGDDGAGRGGPDLKGPQHRRRQGRERAGWGPAPAIPTGSRSPLGLVRVGLSKLQASSLFYVLGDVACNPVARRGLASWVSEFILASQAPRCCI
ncbi:spidroin-1-like isoform X2 [Trachypithecus francoisi]|uniref:spidroin-1-like isoform X2 n=1 Tax=Trachypithecus francoisi TaxID=54180 RepID=UPI00141BCA34|nr:spidroin-1-like isoform X2 [Trachypithecus francoisi]